MLIVAAAGVAEFFTADVRLLGGAILFRLPWNVFRELLRARKT
jgi:hypothetical protein